MPKRRPTSWLFQPFRISAQALGAQVLSAQVFSATILALTIATSAPAPPIRPAAKTPPSITSPRATTPAAQPRVETVWRRTIDGWSPLRPPTRHLPTQADHLHPGLVALAQAVAALLLLIALPSQGKR